MSDKDKVFDKNVDQSSANHWGRLHLHARTTSRIRTASTLSVSMGVSGSSALT